MKIGENKQEVSENLRAFDKKCLEIVLKNSPDLASSLCGSIGDICIDYMLNFIRGEEKNKFEIEIPYNLLNTGYADDLKELLLYVKSILSIYDESEDRTVIVEDLSAKIRHILGNTYGFVTAALNGEVFDKEYIQSKIGNFEFHKEYELIINNNLLTKDRDQEILFLNVIKKDNFFEIIEIVNQYKEEFKKKNYEFEVSPISNNTVLNNEEEYLPLFEKEDFEIDGVYLVISKDDKVFASSWSKDLRSCVSFIQSNLVSI